MASKETNFDDHSFFLSCVAALFSSLSFFFCSIHNIIIIMFISLLFLTSTIIFCVLFFFLLVFWRNCDWFEFAVAMCDALRAHHRWQRCHRSVTRATFIVYYEVWRVCGGVCVYVCEFAVIFCKGLIYFLFHFFHNLWHISGDIRYQYTHAILPSTPPVPFKGQLVQKTRRISLVLRDEIEQDSPMFQPLPTTADTSSTTTTTTTTAQSRF